MCGLRTHCYNPITVTASIMSLAYLRNVNTKFNSALNKQDIENIHTEIIFLVFNARDRLPSLQNNNKLRDFSPQANYIDRATAACRRSYCKF
jgi:hypothetical protein